MTFSVILPDGSARQLEDGQHSLDLATSISAGLAQNVVVARVDGVVQDLRVPLREGQRVELLKAESPEGRDTINHSAEHLLATAVCTLFPGAKVTMGPKDHSEEFYYDFDVGRAFTPDDLEKIEAEVHKLIAAKMPFERVVTDKVQAAAIFDEKGQNNEYKREILGWIPDDDTVTLYQNGGFVDLCRGPHLPHAGFIKGLKIMAASAAYWRGDSSRQSLQRVKGVAFPKKDELQKHLHRLEEAKKRDHRRLGKELELFIVSERFDDHDYDPNGVLELHVEVQQSVQLESVSADQWLVLAVVERLRAITGRKIELKRPELKVVDDLGPNEAHLELFLVGALSHEHRQQIEHLNKDGLFLQRARTVVPDLDLKVAVRFDTNITEEIGPGLVMWLPKGGRLRAIIEEQWRKMHFDGGYDVVYSPHIAKTDLWKVSGHWNFYRDGMFSPMSIDGHDYVCKPMNCPFHCLMVKSRQRSYREFPMRLAELGTVYRYELAGVMHGLMRVRGFTQDDAHLFCRRDQVEGEIDRVISFILRMLRTFGFTEFEVNLSTRPEKFVGSVEDWDIAERLLEEAIKRHNLPYQVDPGGGAFYGPKIDIKLVDALDRKWQCSTLQYDFNNPARFNLEFVTPKGDREQPIMLHRALLGSIERFIGILVEHYAGALPGWLSPEQVRIVTVSDRHNEHAHTLLAQLEAAGFRASFTESSDKLGAKIRQAQLEKIPVMLVVGDKEVEQGGATIRLRDGTDKGLLAGDALHSFLNEVCSVPVVDDVTLPAAASAYHSDSDASDDATA